MDSITSTDRTTGRTFDSQLMLACSLMSYSDDAGANWSPSTGCGQNTLLDHQTVGGGPFAPSAIGPLTSYPNAVYYCAQNGFNASCALSRDGGATFGPGSYITNTPANNPGDPVLPTTSTAKASYSDDHGKTWSTAVDRSSKLGVHNVQFAELVAGDAGRAAIAFLGTNAIGDDQHHGFNGPDGNPAVWHLYVSLTYDGGKSWTTYDTTPDHPVQRGCVDLQGTSNKTVTDDNICSQRNLLDFNDITMDKQGRVLVAYAEACQATPNCLTDPTVKSTEAVDTVMRLQTGKGLVKAYDGKLR